jgi:hypothetical protein
MTIKIPIWKRPSGRSDAPGGVILAVDELIWRQFSPHHVVYMDDSGSYVVYCRVIPGQFILQSNNTRSFDTQERLLAFITRVALGVEHV